VLKPVPEIDESLPLFPLALAAPAGDGPPVTADPPAPTVMVYVVP
jgi:hypothetical protein